MMAHFVAGYRKVQRPLFGRHVPVVILAINQVVDFFSAFVGGEVEEVAHAV